MDKSNKINDQKGNLYNPLSLGTWSKSNLGNFKRPIPIPNRGIIMFNIYVSWFNGFDTRLKR